MTIRNFNSLELWPEKKIPLQKFFSHHERRVPDPAPIKLITGVNYPTLLPFLVEGKKRPAVIVFPGGAYDVLALDYEGTEIAEMLNKAGIAAFVLKYRCPRQREAALCDAARAVRYVKSHAKEFNLDKENIGVMGFSAGAHLICSLACAASKKIYEPSDALDKLSCKPAFCALIYPAYLNGAGTKLAPDLKIPKNHPPTFLLQASDDPYFPSLPSYLLALLEKGVPCETHVFSKGGHGFGSRLSKTPCDAWFALFLEWFKNLKKEK